LNESAASKINEEEMAEAIKKTVLHTKQLAEEQDGNQ